MDKGKTKKNRKYMSIMLVPHFSGEVKAFRFSIPFIRIFTLLVVTAITIIVARTSVVISSTIAENNNLKKNIEALTKANSEQQKLLGEKVKEIDKLMAFEESIDDRIADLTNKYRDLTDTYVTNRIEGSIASRSGDRDSQREFVSDINELKSILATIAEINKDKELKNIADLTEAEDKLKKYIDSVPTVWPVNGRLCDKYGYRIHPIYKRRIFHEGVDISAPYGTSIKATASGTVKLAGSYGGYGNAIIIDHGYGISTLYGHASKLLVKKGQKVNKGDIIARVGSTGISTGPHLHYEIHLYGNHIDPLIYLDSK
jgi:murein DD-endopeptidase MepM/ murein hydrolase activator NlpD